MCQRRPGIISLRKFPPRHPNGAMGAPLGATKSVYPPQTPPPPPLCLWTEGSWAPVSSRCHAATRPSNGTARCHSLEYSSKFPLGIRTRGGLSALVGLGLAICSTRPGVLRDHRPDGLALLAWLLPAWLGPRGQLQLVRMGGAGPGRSRRRHPPRPWTSGRPGRGQPGWSPLGGSRCPRSSLPPGHRRRWGRSSRGRRAGSGSGPLGRSRYGLHSRPGGSHRGGASGNR